MKPTIDIDSFALPHRGVGLGGFTDRSGEQKINISKFGTSL